MMKIQKTTIYYAVISALLLVNGTTNSAEIANDTKITDFVDDGTGVNVADNARLDGEGSDFTVTGTIKDGPILEYGIINNGIIDNFAKVTAEGIQNKGTIDSASGTIVLRGSGYSGLLSNNGKIIIGSIIDEGTSWEISPHVGNGKTGELIVFDGIKSDISNSGLVRYGSGILEGTLDNGGVFYAEMGKLTIDGDFYSGDNAILGKNENENLDTLIVNGVIEYGESGDKNSKLLVSSEIQADAIRNYAHISSDKIVLGNLYNTYLSNRYGVIDADVIELNGDGGHTSSINGKNTSGTPYYGSSEIYVHKRFVLNNKHIFNNYGDVIFDGNSVTVDGDGCFNNAVISFNDPKTWKKTKAIGLLAKNAEKDPISSIVFRSALNNQGEIYAENLAVTTGVDGIEQADGSFEDSAGFHVQHLTVLDDGDFSLQSAETNLTSLAIEEGATLHAVKKVSVSEALTGDGTLDTGNSGEFIAEKASAIGAIIGKGDVTAAGGLTVRSIDDFGGTLRLSGNSVIGVTSLESGAADTVTLTLPAGYSFGDSKVIVGAGADTADAAAASTLTMLDGTSLAIVVGDDYAGSSLVTAPTAAVPASTKVFVYNAASLEDGTLVIDTTDGEAPAGYEVHAETDNLLKVIRDNQIVTLSASEALGADVLGGSVFADAINSDGLAAERVAALTTGTAAASAAKALTSIALMGTGGAAQAVAVNAATMAADTIEQHGSRLAAYTHDEQGGDLWVTLNGNFSRALNYKAGSSSYGYKSDLAGATIGADYAFGNGAAAGAAFTFGTGSARGQGNAAGTKNDIDYYAFHFYGVWNTPYVNLIGHVGYGWTENEISQGGYKGTPDVTTISAGIRAEKPIAVSEVFTVTPHIGIRYLNVDMDVFSAGGFDYGADEANLVQMPVGIAFSGDYKAACGAAVKPYLDLQISPAFGDDEVTNRFAVAGSTVADTFDARIANSALYSAKVGLEAERNGHSLALSYSAGIGAHDRVDQALQAKYRFSF